MQASSLPFVSDLGKARVFDIAIVGGGFSGVMTAVHLLRHCPPTSSILLIERSDKLGRGVAFGTTTAQHLLNVPAKNMSAFADEPGHFLQWVQRHKDSDVSPNTFVPRQWYGEYVDSILADQVRKANSARLSSVRGEVVGVDQHDRGVRLTFADSSQIVARLVVLAVGNFPPPDPLPLRQLPSRHYARYAWSPEALEGIANSDSVLLIGSGLTAIDQVVTLEKRGHSGPIYMLSRRGLLPATHRHENAWPAAWTDDLPTSIRCLFQKVREQVNDAKTREVGWRPVIDSLRPATQRLWKNMELAERRRFLRHVRCFWEVHRHRIAPEIGTLIDELRRNGRLRTEAGRVVECITNDGHVEVRYRNRETGELRAVQVSRIVNCTGHETDARKIDSPIVQSLLANRLARVDASAQGLDVTDDGAVVDDRGRASKTLFALGSVRKGLLWESTAVPELRVQAQALGSALAAQLAEVPQAFGFAG